MPIQDGYVPACYGDDQIYDDDHEQCFNCPVAEDCRDEALRVAARRAAVQVNVPRVPQPQPYQPPPSQPQPQYRPVQYPQYPGSPAPPTGVPQGSVRIPVNPLAAPYWRPSTQAPAAVAPPAAVPTGIVHDGHKIILNLAGGPTPCPGECFGEMVSSGLSDFLGTLGTVVRVAGGQDNLLSAFFGGACNTGAAYFQARRLRFSNQVWDPEQHRWRDR